MGLCYEGTKDKIEMQVCCGRNVFLQYNVVGLFYL